MNSASVAAVPSVPVADNEPVLSGTVKSYLERADMSAQICGDGLIALDFVRVTAPDAMVLGLGLPGVDGVEVCRRLHIFSDCCVSMFTARVDGIDRLIGLSVGADGYMTEPFSPRELMTRIQVLLRRPRAGSTGATAAVVRRIDAFTLNPSLRWMELDASPVELTRTKFDLLQVLTEHPGWVLNRHQLTGTVWGKDWVGDDHLVGVHIVHLHKKLGDGPPQSRFVQTVRDVGYRMSQGQ